MLATSPVRWSATDLVLIEGPADRVEAQRRIAARSTEQAPADADGPAAPQTGAADGRAEALRGIAARGGAR